MVRVVAVGCLPLLLLALAACDCATGETKGDDDVADDDGGGTGDCPGGCPDGTVCRDGECIDAGEDADGDGFPAAEDCDDEDPDVNPDAAEVCDGIDNDCSGGIDEPFDNDRDGYTTCGGGRPELRDCNDRDPAVHPGAPERCNGADDDCDSEIDEDTGEEDLCPGGGFCIDGECDYNCPDGFVDLDGSLKNGCECESDLTPDVGPSCDSAIDEGEFWDNGGGESREYVGIVVPADREVWYRFRAQDFADDGCDDFHVRVQFLENPGNQFIMDVFRDDPGNELLLCEEAPLCDTGDIDFEWFTDFSNGVGTEGECPCTAGNTAGAQICNDDTADFSVRVRRIDPGVDPTCDEYRIEVSNGIY